MRTVISLGRSLNKRRGGRGHRDARAQLLHLRQMGATIGQGYLLSRPLTVTQVGELLKEPALAPV